MSQQNHERRRFHRIATDKPVLVSCGGQQHTGTVLDISLRGLLFETTGGWQPAHDAPVQARVELDPAEVCCIEMQGVVAHVDGNRIGIRATSLDLDSASRLKRLVELNLADHDQLERDLAELLHA